VVTSNRAPSEWPELFGNPLLASAGLDRLAHHAESVIITGRSFRAASSAANTAGSGR
jgi:DNA replication protein DnaC